MGQTTMHASPAMPDLGATLSDAAVPMELAAAEELALRVYGILATASLLTSERDQNFLLRSAAGPAWVLKVTHPGEDPQVTDFQTKIQLHVMRPEFALPVPQLVPTLAGEAMHWHESPLLGRRAVRLITFIDGKPMHQELPRASQRFALGQVLARFDRALESFDHPQAGHVLLWDIQHAVRLKPFIQFVDSKEDAALANYFMDRFETQVAPRLAGLRQQVIHNDLNKFNVLTSGDGSDEIIGLLDFGDMVRGPLVQDVAVAGAYQLDGAGDPLEGALQLSAGYHSANPLSLQEWGILPDLIATRHLLTVLITGWRAKQYPENSTYILRNNPLAWRGLRHLRSVGVDTARSLFIEASQKTVQRNAP